MNWEAIGAIGQLVSALALFLVLFQVRHARNEMRRSASQARKDGSRTLWLAAAQPDLASVMSKAQAAAGQPPSPAVQYLMGLGLTYAETRQVQANFMAIWQNIEMSVESRAHLSAGAREELRSTIQFNYGPISTLGSKLYEMAKPRLNRDAVRYVDEVLAHRSPSGPELTMEHMDVG
jgi:hypothetical protein